MSGKFYWLKLKRDFFKRHDIQIVESMPNGKDYILFYLKLLCESVDHEGNLRFSEEIPYNRDMLATITNTNIDTVGSAIDIFTKLGMMEILDDGTLYMREVEKMIGSAVDNDNANRQRRYRERQKALALVENSEAEDERYDSVTKSNESKSKSKRKIQSKSKSILSPQPPLTGGTTKRFVPPTVEEVADYCFERQNGIDAEKFVDYYQARGWDLGKGRKMKDWKACVRTWERNNKSDEKSGFTFLDL